MNLVVFEQDKAYVQRSLENGEIDYIEVASEGAETEFFQYINGRGILRQLADTYPLERRKHDVPLWLYIASDLSLRLHGMQSFHGYPLVIRTGELLNALGPEVGKKVIHPETEGIFIGDASYVFVPDNENYEGSVVLLFDEHNHPVKKEELSPEQFRRCRWRRCYKWVELIHTNAEAEYFFFVGMRLGSGKAHECPILYELVEQFLQVVGRGVMKWLIVDRGFLDGKRMGHLKEQWGVDTLSGLRSDMNVLEDARGLLRLEPVEWQDYQPVKPPPVTAPKPESIIKREKRRQRTLKAQGRWPQLPPPEKVVAFSDLRSWDSCPVPLTVVLTQRHDKPPWGLVTTAHTQDAPFVRERYHLRETIEERHRQAKLFWDLTGFHSPNFNLVTNQVVFVALTYTLLQMQLLRENRPELNRMSRRRLQHIMLPYGNHIVVYAQEYYAFFDVAEYTEIIMSVVEPGKSKLLKKVRRIRHDFRGSLNHPRGP